MWHLWAVHMPACGNNTGLGGNLTLLFKVSQPIIHRCYKQKRQQNTQGMTAHVFFSHTLIYHCKNHSSKNLTSLLPRYSSGYTWCTLNTLSICLWLCFYCAVIQIWTHSAKPLPRFSLKILLQMNGIPTKYSKAQQVVVATKAYLFLALLNYESQHLYQ